MADMTAKALASYLRRIRTARSAPELRAIALEVTRIHSADEATETLIAVMRAKAARLASAN